MSDLKATDSADLIKWADTVKEHVKELEKEKVFVVVAGDDDMERYARKFLSADLSVRISKFSSGLHLKGERKTTGRWRETSS